jgi:hypothetical protein
VFALAAVRGGDIVGGEAVMVAMVEEEEEEEEDDDDDRPPTVTTQKGWSKRRDGLFSMRVRACRHEGGRRRLSRQS